ncbi:MAG: hypothetical protein HZA54_18840 [Planctomycetes bacterium]|nr:hypothetical protein [Planctomycetota bacterium]
MGLMDFFAGRRAGRAEPSLDEVRHEEARVTVREGTSLARLERLEGEKDGIFAAGARQKSGARRVPLARQFAAKEAQVAQAERELARLSKEATTLAVLRRALERRRDREAGVLGLLSRVREEELARLLEDDKIGYELYLEKLDGLLGAAESPARDALAEIGKEGREVIEIWQQMEEGELASAEQGLKLAEQAARRRARAAEPAERALARPEPER